MQVKATGTKRVTLRFRSDRDRDYLYDDATGCIFPWNDLREAVVELVIADKYDRGYAALASQYGRGNVQATHRFVTRWLEKYGAFVRAWDDSHWEACRPVQLEHFVRNRSFGLILILTENCNLRCRYCILSDIYPLNRVRTGRKMSFTTARRAVDWYVKLVEPQITRNPQKRFGLSFYGGEPMTNMPLLKEILRYSRDNYPGIFQPVMTTNGTLLSSKNVEILVENEVQLAVSIDGPKKEHDRLRIDARNSGTFNKIVQNLRRMKKEYPHYWATKVTSLSVYDWGTDIEAVERFFNDNEEVIPRSIFVNPVADRNTDWYSRYTEDDRRRLEAALQRLREKYKTAKMAGYHTSHYLDSAIGMGVVMVPLRPRILDSRPAFLPFSGACVPGDKIAINVDGKIDMCERVNGTYPIGHLENGGIDWERIKEIIEKYQRQVLLACPQCKVTRLCNLCFSHTESNGEFVLIPGMCAGIVESARQRLCDYVSILEENPGAKLTFETDTVHLEEQLLFTY
jgi:uncharacterized protein